MKTKLCLGIFLLAAAMLRAQTNDLTALLQQGLFEEQANRNLDAAIADYSSLAAQFDKDRQLAATAVFRLGECYRAQGRTNEAAAQYQRILRDFSDQQPLATLSRQDLTGMGMTKAEPVAAANSDAALWNKLKDLAPAELEKILPTLVPDPTLDNLLQQRNVAQVQRASLRVNYATNNSKVEENDRLLAELNRQITEKVSGVMQALKLRAELAPPSFQEQLQKIMAKSSPGTDAATADDEDREIQRIQQMIQNSPDLINAPGEGGMTPLNRAAENGWRKVAAFLLDHGADVNAGGIPPLNSAATAGNRAMTELLLSRGANVNSKGSQGKGSQGKTPLHIAVEKKFPAVAEVLLANKADVNAQDTSGDSPLGSAAWNGQVKIIQMLLAAGANANVENNQGRTPLSFAAERGSPEIVKLFLAAKADPNGRKLDAPLLAAIYAKDVASAELLLQAGANPNAKGRVHAQDNSLGFREFTPDGFAYGWATPLWLATRMDQLPIVQLLLKFKADPNDTQADRESILFGALPAPKVLTALLDAGGKVDARRWNGWTLLEGAVASTNLTAVQLLLKFKADPNDSQFEGRSILFRALSNTNILEALLDAGANIDPVTPDETEWTPLGNAANQKNVAAMEILLKHGANPNFHNRNGVTPLHWAAYGHADSKVLKLLLEAKANPNVRTGNGKTPLDELKGNQNISNGRGILPVRALAPRVNSIPEGTLAYQWSAGNPDANSPETPGTNIIALLHQYGAVDNLPNWDRIAVSRSAANFSADIFRKGTNDWNHFTLQQLIYKTYQSYGQQTPFPDFSRVTVVRPGANGAAEKRIEVNLLTATNSLDFAKDVPLEFGDVVEIPERGHTLAEHDDWLNGEMQKLIWHFREIAGEVRLVVAGGQTVQVPLNNWTPDNTYLGEVLRSSAAQNALTSGSDLSRVKVTRRDLKSKKTDVWVLDCSRINYANGYPFWNAPDLLLRDGDVLEVPLKP